MRSTLILILALTACKKTPPAHVDPLDRPIGMAPQVSMGVLDNGLHWYWIEGGEAPEITVVVAADIAGDEATLASEIADSVTGKPEVELSKGRVELGFPEADLEHTLEQVANWACCVDLEGPAGRFRADWVRPQNLAILVTGMGSPDEASAEIEGALGKVFEGTELVEVEREATPARSWQPTRSYEVVTGAPSDVASVELLFEYPRPEGDTVRWLRGVLLEDLGFAIMDTRLDALEIPSVTELDAERVQVAPVTGGHVVRGEGEALTTYEALLTEVRRLGQWGVLNSEIRQSEGQVIEAYRGRANTPRETDVLVDMVVRNFAEGAAVPGRQREAEIAETYVPSFAVLELRDWAQHFGQGPSRVRVVLPEGSESVTEADLKSVEARVTAAILEPPFDAGTLTQLTPPPSPGSITDRDDSLVEALGVERWTLSNGARVWVRDMPGPITFRAVRRGGLDLYAEPEFLLASLVPAMRAAGGYAQLEPAEITRYLAARGASMNPSITEHEAMLSGGANAGEVDTTLQLIHLAMTAPRFTDEGFVATVKRLAAVQVRKQDDPTVFFEDAWNEAVWPTDPWRRPVGNEAIEKLDPDRAEAVWEGLFEDPSAFDFVFAGELPEDFDLLVEQWLGSVPRPQDSARAQARHHERVAGEELRVERGLEARSRVRIEYAGRLEGSMESRELLQVVAELLQVRLRERIMEQRGGVYGVRVSAIAEPLPTPSYRLRVEFTTHPDLLDGHRDRALAMIEAFTSEELDPFYTDSATQQNAARRERNEHSSVFWASALTEAVRFGDEPMLIADYAERNAALTPESVAVAARQLLDPSRRTVGVLVPEAGAVDAPPPLSFREDD